MGTSKTRKTTKASKVKKKVVVENLQEPNRPLREVVASLNTQPVPSAFECPKCGSQASLTKDQPGQAVGQNRFQCHGCGHRYFDQR